MLKAMKSRRSLHFLLFCTVFLGGVLSGAVFQKKFSLGSVLRSVGIPYPTRVAPVDPYALSVVDVPEDHQGRMLLFILVGQSNMVGWAPVPEVKKTDPRVYVFGNDYRWRIASDPVDSAYDQVDKISEDHIAFYGLSLGFAFASLEQHPEAVIGLIPCAKNSSAISQWQRNLSDQTLYGSCLKRARAASPMGQIAGILFFQGETDAQDPALNLDPAPQPFQWEHLFTSFIADFRSDLHEPTLPVIFAQLGADVSSPEFPYWKNIQEQQASVDLAMTTMVTTDDLPLMDGLHFTAESYEAIGRRFANAYWELTK